MEMPGARSFLTFSHSPRECHDIARKDRAYLTTGGLHCFMRQNLHTMLSVTSHIPGVSLPNAGLMPELGDGQACHMTFEIIQSFNINVVAPDPLEASNIQFLTH